MHFQIEDANYDNQIVCKDICNAHLISHKIHIPHRHGKACMVAIALKAGKYDLYLFLSMHYCALPNVGIAYTVVGI